MVKVNWEKIGVYLGILGFIYTFWYSEINTKNTLAEVRERTRALEVKIDKLEAT